MDARTRMPEPGGSTGGTGHRDYIRQQRAWRGSSGSYDDSNRQERIKDRDHIFATRSSSVFTPMGYHPEHLQLAGLHWSIPGRRNVIAIEMDAREPNCYRAPAIARLGSGMSIGTGSLVWVSLSAHWEGLRLAQQPAA